MVVMLQHCLMPEEMQGSEAGCESSYCKFMIRGDVGW